MPLIAINCSFVSAPDVPPVDDVMLSDKVCAPSKDVVVVSSNPTSRRRTRRKKENRNPKLEGELKQMEWKS